MTTRVASIAGPPSATAVMQTPMKAAELPMTSTWPPPIRPMRTDCNAVVTPEIATAANTAQATDASGAPAARITTMGNRIGTATVRNDELQAETEGERRRRVLVGLVANAPGGIRVAGAHVRSGARPVPNPGRRGAGCAGTGLCSG